MQLKNDYLGIEEGKEKDEWHFVTFIIAIMNEITIVLLTGKRIYFSNAGDGGKTFNWKRFWGFFPTSIINELIPFFFSLP